MSHDARLPEAVAEPVRLADYRPPAWLIDTVHLDIALDRTRTTVTARLALRPNPAGGDHSVLELDGDELGLLAAELDATPLAEGQFEATPSCFRLLAPPAKPFSLTLRTQIDPSANTRLMGLYRSSSAYCTQCEAEGFRRITYFLDRPDVLATYTTRIEAALQEAPTLLANGNRTEAGLLPGGRHYAIWHDPFPKPSYLFAMVAGDLAVIRDSFTTASGREVTLEIHVEHGRQDRCAYAMDALKRSMRWDEEKFGREYDLDIFMIVAVSDFNMGAMENKGLNIFNDKYVLALPETATDQDYANIEAIIAHEYFHNWTGNRITCRDWFQLCLKEGLTVFRDQEFSADQRSRSVKRISDVKVLRSQQFAEDGGPLAHPVRPETYLEINNFYTATVYEKGAEIVRMLKALIGDTAFAAGLELYFHRHDGQAVTIEDFLACFAETCGQNLSQFMLWYRQSGTPEITATGTYDEKTATYTLELSQHTPPTPGQLEKQPVPIPVRCGLVGEDGDLCVTLNGKPFTGLLTLTETSQRFVFTNVQQAPALSLLRDFSAPVKLRPDPDEKTLLTLLARDSDPFNRWQAGQTYATRLLVHMMQDETVQPPAHFIEALQHHIAQAAHDPAFTALALNLPSEADLAREIGSNVDPDAIFRARSRLRISLSRLLQDDLRQAVNLFACQGPYSPDASSAGRRSLRNVALDLACAGGSKPALSTALAQFEQADNMTDEIAALSILVFADGPEGRQALHRFHERYSHDMLVIDKWLGVQAAIPHGQTLDNVRALAARPEFSLHNPNRVRALIGTFASANQTQFNRADGEGYRFVGETILTIDPKNPQLAARLLGAFKTWRMLEPGRRAQAQTTLEKIAAIPTLSRDVSDIAQRCLAQSS